VRHAAPPCGKRLAGSGGAAQTARVTSTDPIEPTEITAGRLHLRPWQPADAVAVFAVWQDAEMARWADVPDPYTEDHARRFVEQEAPDRWAAGTGTPFAVVDAVDGRLLAAVSFGRLADGLADVGYWTVPAERGQGVATEALGVLCRWGFAALGLDRITWLAYEGHETSRRVAEKVGFRFEGTLRGYLPYRGGRRDTWVAGLLATDPVPDPHSPGASVR
jgi:RimJ/RimL family protein N-acetyltransferase